MLVTIDGRLFRYGFRHEPDWEPLDLMNGQPVLDVPKAHGVAHRHVRGRTICSIVEVIENAACIRHTATNPDGPCTCDKKVLVEAAAFCSVKDQYVVQEGRKQALKHALVGFPREFRRRVWGHYLRTVPQLVRIPARTARRRVVPADAGEPGVSGRHGPAGTGPEGG